MMSAENLFDYTNQAWVRDGQYIRCGHPAGMNCKCYGKIHEGEQADMVSVRSQNGLPENPTPSVPLATISSPKPDVKLTMLTFNALGAIHESETVTLESVIEANQDEPEIVAGVSALKPGSSIRFGGGAQPIVEFIRFADRSFSTVNPTVVEVPQTTLEALATSGFPEGGDIHDDLAIVLRMAQRSDFGRSEVK